LFKPLGKWQAAILEAERKGPKLRAICGDSETAARSPSHVRLSIRKYEAHAAARITRAPEPGRATPAAPAPKRPASVQSAFGSGQTRTLDVLRSCVPYPHDLAASPALAGGHRVRPLGDVAPSYLPAPLTNVLRNPWHVEPRTRFSTEYPVKSARSDKRLTNRLLDAL
jgi:hypothetical protein